MKRVVRRGCFLYPLLFNLYSEANFEEAILRKKVRIKIWTTKKNTTKLQLFEICCYRRILKI